jgi:hypothetical protein
MKMDAMFLQNSGSLSGYSVIFQGGKKKKKKKLFLKKSRVFKSPTHFFSMPHRTDN